MQNFHLSNKFVLLFREWRAESSSEHLVYAAVVFIIALVHELLVAYVTYLNSTERARRRNRRYAVRVVGSLAYEVTSILRYSLMFTVMVQSVLLCVALLTGSALGYFIVGPASEYFTTTEKRTGNSNGVNERGKNPDEFELELDFGKSKETGNNNSKRKDQDEFELISETV